jgi:hypothetical protein
VFGYRPDCRNHLSLFLKKFRVHETLITAPSGARLAGILKSLHAIPNLFAYYSFFQSWNGVGEWSVGVWWACSLPLATEMHVPCWRTCTTLRAFLSRRSCPRRIMFHAGENEAVVRAALSAAAGHQFRSARHPDFRAALEHSSRGGLAGKQCGDRRSPHLYARGPRRPAGVRQEDLYRDLSRHSRRCDDVAKTVASPCCGSDGRKNRKLVAHAATCRVVLHATHKGALAHCSLGDLKRFAVSIMLCQVVD